MDKKQLKLHFKTLMKQNSQIKKQLAIVFGYAKKQNIKAIAEYIKSLPQQTALDVVMQIADVSVKMKGVNVDTFLLNKLEIEQQIVEVIYDKWEQLDSQTKQKLNTTAKKIMETNSKTGAWSQSIVEPWADLYIELNKDKLFSSKFFVELGRLENNASPNHIANLKQAMLDMIQINGKEDIDALIEFFQQQKQQNREFVNKLEMPTYKSVLFKLRMTEEGVSDKLGFYMWEKVTDIEYDKEEFLNIYQLSEDIPEMDNEQKVRALQKYFAFDTAKYPLREKRYYYSFLRKSIKTLNLEQLKELIPILDEVATGTGNSLANLICADIKDRKNLEFFKQEQKTLAQAKTPQEREQLINNILSAYKNYGYIFDSVWEKTYEIAKNTVKNLTLEQFKERVGSNINIKQYLEEITDYKIRYNPNGQETEDALYYVLYDDFAAIFPKTRFQEFPEKDVLVSLTEDQIKNFNLKTYKKFMETPEFSENRESMKAFAQFATIMGIFEADSEVEKRIEVAYKLLESGVYSEYAMQRLRTSGVTNEEIAEYFEQTAHKVYKIEAIIEDEELLNFFNNYTTGANISYGDSTRYRVYSFTEAEFKQFKSMTGVLGKKVNDFISPYKKVKGGYEKKRGVEIPTKFADTLTNFIDDEKYNELIGNKAIKQFLKPFQEKTISKYKIKENIPQNYISRLNQYKQSIIDSDQINARMLHDMFDGLDLDRQFNKDFYDFLINYWDYAKNLQNRTKLKDVQKVYHKAVTYYSEHGNNSPSYLDVLTFIENSPFTYSYGNKEFAIQVKNSGVGIQHSYLEYEKMLPKLESRKLTTIPRHNKTYEYEVDGKKYKVCTKILRLDDPTTMLVGESKFTNCCQKYSDAGQACMEHSATSQNGGILATYLVEEDGTMQMLTQSWVWTNEQMLCLDNIEATNVIKISKQQKLYQDIAIFGIKMAGEDILEQSQKSVEEYYNLQIALAKTSLEGEEYTKRVEFLDQLKLRQTLRVITVGTGYDDVGVSGAFSQKLTDDVGPKGYVGYRDSRFQYVVASTNAQQIQSSPNYQEVPIYRDPRRIFRMQGKNITEKMLKHITDIEKDAHKKHMVMYTKDNKNVLIDPQKLAEIYSCAEKDLKIIVGEDWYIVYADYGKEIEIFDIAKTTPRLDDEKQAQQKEMMGAFNEILDSAVYKTEGETMVKTIEADLREDTSYLLYLFQKRHGRLEQVGEDLRYDFEQDSEKTPVTQSQQLEFLKNAKQIRENSEENKTIMHSVKFVPSQKIVDKNGQKVQDEDKEIL